jgi:hypothetical protein
MSKSIEIANPLLTALEFISVAQKAKATDGGTFCMLSMHAAVAFDGLLAAGVRIAEDLHCCPNTQRLIAALCSCSSGYQMTHVAHDRLLVQSGEFQAHVPLCDPRTLTWPQPDPKLVVADNKIVAALKAVSGVINDKAAILHEAAILLQGQTCVGTNGAVILEAFHGWDLPPDILLPKAIVAALVNAHKPLVAMGYGTDTVTFWFEDDSWIRTQRYVEKYPDAHKLLATPVQMIPFPIGLFTATDQLAPFSEDGQVYCANGKASSHAFGKADSFNARLTLDVSGINESRIYRIDTIKIVRKIVTHFDDQTLPKRTFFMGGMDVKLGTKKSDIVRVPVRGVMTHGSEDADKVDPNTPVNIGATRQSTRSGYCGLYTGICEGYCDGTCLHNHIPDDDIPF